MSPSRRPAGARFAGVALAFSAAVLPAGLPAGLAAGQAAGQAAGDAATLLTFQDPEITESSGLADLGDVLLTVNDSGSDPVVHLVDRATGETVGRTTYAEEVVDVEALAVGPDGSVWVADIGDNAARRMSVAVYRLPPVRPGDRTVQATRFELGYVGGPRDAEALLVHPRTGRLFVVSKGLFGGQVFAAPARLDADSLAVLRPVGDAGPLVTDGAFLPDGDHAVLRSYTGVTLHATDPWAAAASASLPRQRQGEGLAVTAGGEELLLSSEGERSAVLVVPLAAELRAALAEGPNQGDPPAEDPAAVDDANEPATPPEQMGTGRPGAGVLAAAALAAVAALAVAVRAARRRGRSRR